MVLDLSEDPDAPVEPLDLGKRVGRNALVRYLRDFRELGANHVMFNLVAGSRSTEEVLQEISADVMGEVGETTEAVL